MKKFLLRLLAFSALATTGIAVAVLVVIVLNRRGLDDCHLGEDVDSVIIGDSHAMWSINDAEVPRLRNVALNAEGYKYSYAKLKHLLESETGLKKVYVAFSYHNLAGYYDEYIFGETFKFYVENFVPILRASDYVDVMVHTPGAIPGLLQRIVQKGLEPGISGQCLIYGGFPDEDMTETFRLESVRERIAFQFYSDGKVVPPSRSNLENLERIVDLARARGLEITMLNTPLHPEYVRRIPKQYRDLYDRFIEEHALTQYSFEGLLLKDEAFLPDGDHTNRLGAELSTREFRRYHEAH